MTGEMSVQPYTEITLWQQSYRVYQKLHQLRTISSEAAAALRKPDPSPTVVKIMNLPVAAKLVISKKYFYVF